MRTILPRSRWTAVFAGALVLLVPVGAQSAFSAAPNPAVTRPVVVSWVNRAQADVQKDGRNRYDVAFDVDSGHGDEVDAVNSAVARSACTGCRSVALAFQVGLFTSLNPVVRADNSSLALTESCDHCVTVAAAYQFLVVTDEPLRLTPAGRRRLSEIQAALRGIARSDTGDDEIEQHVADLEAQVIDVLTTETRQVHRHGQLRLRHTVSDRPGVRRTSDRVRPLG